jgi:hypothetical protein
MECMQCKEEFNMLCSAENVWEHCCWNCFQDYINHYEHDNMVTLNTEDYKIKTTVDVTKCENAVVILEEW